MKTILFCLGRFGDILNVLPIAWRENWLGNRVTVCVAKEFQSLLHGITYADSLVWPGNYNEPDRALAWLRQAFPGARIINAQAYRHPTDKQRLTPSYQTEAWRLAGRLEEFGMWPTVIDRRDGAREKALHNEHVPPDKPAILIGLHSISSPLQQRIELTEAICFEFQDTHRIVDLAGVKAGRLYDLLGFFDQAACLVTADTAFLHLARACRVPVVALISEGNVGAPVSWFGSIPPPNTIAAFRYSTLRVQISPVLDAIQHVIRPATNRSVVHVVDNHGDTDRHERARATWVDAAGDSHVLCCYRKAWPQRREPFLRDVLETALKLTVSDDEVVIWSNSDTSFVPGAFAEIRRHAQRWGACSVRRQEMDGRPDRHIGRDVFAFRADWLRSHLPTIPDFRLGCCQFDLVLAALIRRTRGVPSNKVNLHHDIFPCEMERGLVLHEPHESTWLDSNGNAENQRLARQWCAENCPTLKL